MTTAECWEKERRASKIRFSVELCRSDEWHTERVRFPAAYQAIRWAEMAMAEEEWTAARVHEVWPQGNFLVWQNPAE